MRKMWSGQSRPRDLASLMGRLMGVCSPPLQRLSFGRLAEHGASYRMSVRLITRELEPGVIGQEVSRLLLCSTDSLMAPTPLPFSWWAAFLNRFPGALPLRVSDPSSQLLS